MTLYSTESLESIALGIGITVIITFSSLFEKVRELFKITRCPLCLGFWVGLLLAFITFKTPFGMMADTMRWAIRVMAMATTVSILSYFVHRLMELYEGEEDESGG